MLRACRVTLEDASPCPELNPVDYKIWSALQQRVYQIPITNVEQQRERLLQEWSGFDQIIDSAVKTVC